MMKFHVTKTWGGSCFYDCLFRIRDGNVFERIESGFEEHDLAQCDIDLKIRGLSFDLKIQVLFELVKEYLKTCNFGEAYRLMGSCKTLTNVVFYWIFGKNKYQPVERLIYMKRVFFATQVVYDDYMTDYTFRASQNCVPTITVVSDLPDGKHLMPWDMDQFELLSLRVNHEAIGEMITTGPYLGDRGLLMHCYEKDGEVYARDLAFPFCFFLFLEPTNYLRYKNLFLDETSMYYFTRWTMLLQFCFGPYMKSFFYTHGISLLSDVVEDDHLFQEIGNFELVKPVERK